MTGKRAFSKLQFLESGFDATQYVYNDEPGCFTAVIDCKRWANNKLISYFTFDDGRKIVGVTWFGSNYLGLADLPIGSCVELEFRYSKSGKVNIHKVTPFNTK